MRKIIYLIILALLVLPISCTKNWEEHYLSPEEAIELSIWDEIKANPEYSSFVGYIEEYGLDSLFDADQGGSFTLFVPTNEAFSTFNTDTGDMQVTIKYHLLDYVFNAVNVNKSKQVRTITGKFAPVEEIDGEYKFSGMNLTGFSPLHMNGRYYEMDGVAFPLQNLYEYISENTKILKQYVHYFDTIILDTDASTPDKFLPDGRIEYSDSIYTEINYFDSLYFPLNQEDRSKTATFVLFTDEQYVAALDNMASVMGGSIVTGDDIPLVWREEVLIPELIETGLFPNSLFFEDLAVGKLKNVKGDSVDVDYMNIDSDNRILASNGIIFRYLDFQVPEYLYRGEVRIEGEHMVDSIGSGIFFWKPEFKVSGPTEVVSTNPAKSISAGAENDSLVTLTFPEQPYSDEFSFEFYFRNMFPQKYLFVWGSNYRPSGLFEVYANDVLIREFDTFKLRQTVFGENGDYYFPINGNNRFDAVIDFLTEFGDIKITIKYKSGGGTSTITPLNGFNIDFISLIPAE